MKKSYRKPIAILVAVVGAYHVVLFGLHPRLPPAKKAEVIWGDLSNSRPASLETTETVASLCPEAQTTGDTAANMPKANEPVTRVRFEYRPVANAFVNTGDAAKVVMARGSSITIGKETYPLRQIRFERPTGHGQRVIHLVHELKSGKMAVISVPVQISREENRAINALWRYLPKQPGDHNSLDDIHIDINQLLPHDRTFYRYPVGNACNGSLVSLGLTAPVQISASQLAKLDKVLNLHTGTQIF